MNDLIWLVFCHLIGDCMACNSASVSKKDSPCRECILDGQVTRDYWEWRGVQKE